MKKVIYLTVIIMLSFLQSSFCQQEIKGNYRIYLQNGKSANSKVPIILEEEHKKKDTLYTINGQSAVKNIKYYKQVDTSFSFKLIEKDFDYSSIIVDVEQKKNKLIIKPQGEVLSTFKSYKKGVNKRLVIDVSKGIKITKKATKVSAIAIPIKIYLTNKSDSLTAFTNNIESDVNIAITVGKSWEKYSFKEGREAELTNTRNIFAFGGINKLSLTKKNTDERNDGDNILSFSLGGGYQLGYGKLGGSLLIGIDIPTSTIGKNWVFGYQPWIGIGIGYSIFK